MENMKVAKFLVIVNTAGAAYTTSLLVEEIKSGSTIGAAILTISLIFFIIGLYGSAKLYGELKYVEKIMRR